MLFRHNPHEAASQGGSCNLNALAGEGLANAIRQEKYIYAYERGERD